MSVQTSTKSAPVDGGAVERGRELREAGLTELRTFRVLKKEFPHLELRDLWLAAGADLGTGWPIWADRSSLKPVSIRNDPRKKGGTLVPPFPLGVPQTAATLRCSVPEAV